MNWNTDYAMRSLAYLASPAAGRIRVGANVGGKTRFRKGQQPWNAGLFGWQSGGRSAETQFQTGQMPHNHKPLGHERVNRDGVLERKVAEPKTFRPVHVLVWEERNGAVPRGMIVVFKDRNRANIVIENLELITRAENMRRNSHYNRYPKEVSQLIQLRGALNRQINKRAKA